MKHVPIMRATGEHADMEPSGIAIYTDPAGATWFYMVSDNGVIARRKVDLSDEWQTFNSGTGREADFEASDEWQIVDTGAGWKVDFEAITVAAGKLMIGVEAPVRIDSHRYALIREFDPTDTRQSPLGSFTNSEWILKNVDVRGKGGLEALTFVPRGSYPAKWGGGSYYDGLFFASFQATPGAIYVYDLPRPNGQAQAVQRVVEKLTEPLLEKKLSGLSYSVQSGVLYVLYGDNGSWVQELVLDKKGQFKKGEFIEQRRSRLPFFGYEAVAEYQGSLCLGLDPTAEDRKKNGFDEGYISCVPWPGLDPETWADQP